VDDLLAEAGLPPAPRAWPPSHAKLARVAHQATVENQRTPALGLYISLSKNNPVVIATTLRIFCLE